MKTSQPQTSYSQTSEPQTSHSQTESSRFLQLQKFKQNLSHLNITNENIDPEPSILPHSQLKAHHSEISKCPYSLHFK